MNLFAHNFTTFIPTYKFYIGIIPIQKNSKKSNLL